MDQNFYIGQVFEGIYPPDAAVWCATNNAYIQDLYDGTYQIREIVIVPPTKEEQKERRAAAYRVEVDPITSHIQRLRDEEQTEEIVAKIEELIEERAVKVAAIKARYPYPDESDED